jgi:hypothetical protein
VLPSSEHLSYRGFVFHISFDVIQVFVIFNVFDEVVLVPAMMAYRGINPLNAELNPIRHLLALVGARHFVHVSRVRVKGSTLSLGAFIISPNRVTCSARLIFLDLMAQIIPGGE